MGKGKASRRRIGAFSGIIILLVVAWLLWHHHTSYTPNPELYRLGQSSPTEEGSYFLQTDGERTFFIDRQAGRRIYAMNAQGDEVKLISDRPALQILLHEDWLYYTNRDKDGGIYRMGKNGQNREKLVDSSFSSLIGVANGHLYYLDSDENYALKHMDLQSGAIGTLTKDWIGPAQIHAGKLYVVNHSEDWNLYVMNPDGSRARELIAQSVYKFFFTSKGIVTQTERGEIDLHQRQATGEYHTVRLLDYAAKVSIVKDRLLYSLDNGIMYQAALPDKKQKAPPSTNDAPEPLLQPDPPVFGEFFVVGDWLYYYDSMNTSAKLHRIGLPK